MSLNNNLNKILIIDFGSQFTQLIARRIRELGIFSVIVNHKEANNLSIFNNKIGCLQNTLKSILKSKSHRKLLDLSLKSKKHAAGKSLKSIDNC